MGSKSHSPSVEICGRLLGSERYTQPSHNCKLLDAIHLNVWIFAFNSLCYSIVIMPLLRLFHTLYFHFNLKVEIGVCGALGGTSDPPLNLDAGGMTLASRPRSTTACAPYAPISLTICTHCVYHLNLFAQYFVDRKTLRESVRAPTRQACRVAI